MAVLDLSDSRIWNRTYLPAVTKPKIYNILWGGAGCFCANQLVETINGPKPISEIERNDLVLSFNHSEEKYEYKRVVNKFKYSDHPERLIEIKMKDGTIIRVTENHKFFFGGKYRHMLEILSIFEYEKNMENNTGI